MGTGREGLRRAFDVPRERLVDLPEVPDGPGNYTVRLAGVLGDAIRAKVFSQGQRLPGAAAIAWRFRTSTDTARLAVRVLIEQGLVRREPGGGAYVRGVAEKTPAVGSVAD